MFEKYENERLPKILPAAFGKMGSQSDLEATESYSGEMKKTSNLPRCSCTWSEPRSGFFLLSSQGT